MTSIKPTTPSANQSANISDAAEAKKTLSAQSKAGVDPFANDTFESNKPVRVTEDADVNLYAQENDYGWLLGIECLSLLLVATGWW